MTFAASLRRAVTLARWENPSRILIDRFVADTATAIPPGSRILDAGAGECQYAPAFSHCHYVSCDRAVGDASWDYRKISVVADLTALPFRTAAFDAVICTQTLEHVSEPQLVTSELANVLRSGGRLYLSVPFLGDPIHQEPYDFYRYTHYSLKGLVEKAGLSPISVSPLGGLWLLLCSYLWWVAIVYKTSLPMKAGTSRPRFMRLLRRFVGSVLVFAARFWTMLVMWLRYTDVAFQRFTYGYTVIAQKLCLLMATAAMLPPDWTEVLA